ncbi:MAG: NAD(P)-dependent malic enzyme [Candidatus Jordarchaeum sp.]|uniref:NAD(P)-dependent malic enzyme n=1 Tax=Candidatus Jordarchaeum sp. TaxID=2823881 RepID=UPI00404B3120
MSLRELALAYHRDNLPGNGKLEVVAKTPVRNLEDLALAYTPGVAEPARLISKDISKIYDFTIKGNLVAVVSDGSSVLGLGGIGPYAALPVMEGKAILFKMLAGVDAFPICLKTGDPDKVVETVNTIAPIFGGINLEDIGAPSCFKIESRLKKELAIPVFHDDQHGTAVVVLAGLTNALKVVGKKLDEVRVIVNGAGAAGLAVSKFLLNAGVKDLSVCDREGAIFEGRTRNMNIYKEEIAKVTNRERIEGKLPDLMKDADVFIGLSVGGVVNREMVASMADNPIVFAMANPVPEIMPDEALKAGAKVVATGRSDFPNQINNVLGFPGIFRGALDVRASDINEEMKIAAAHAIASLISEQELSEKYIITSPLDPRVMPEEAAAVAEAAMKSGVARIKVNPREVAEHTKKLVNIQKKRTPQLFP